MIDYLRFNSVPSQKLGSTERFECHIRDRSNGDVLALSCYARLAKWNPINAFRHGTRDAIEPAMLQEYYRVIVFNARNEQPLDIVWRGRHHDFEARDMGKPRLK